MAGGMESMSNAPYLLSKHRAGARVGHDVVKDSKYLDGLEDAYQPGRLMGAFAEDAARHYQFSRDEQDAYAIESVRRAQAATREGLFEREITPVDVEGAKTVERVAHDEHALRVDPLRVRTLKPAFCENGTITAGNAASISDGAAALVMSSPLHRLQARPWRGRARCEPRGSCARASILYHRPGFAIRKAIERASWRLDEVDLFEVNEAFAVVAMIAMRELGISRDVLNVNGGACALGHPIGASDARVIATLISALLARGLKRGVASLCIGGGEATAMAVEIV